MRRVWGILGLLCILLPLAACRARGGGVAAPTPSATAPTPGTSTGSLLSGGLRRTYTLYLPAGYTPGKTWPLVVALHGRLGDGAGMRTLTHLGSVADQHGFIVVYPDGYRRSWADGRGATPRIRRTWMTWRFCAR